MAYLESAAIETRMATLAKPGICERQAFLHPTHSVALGGLGTSATNYSMLKIAGGPATNRPGVLIVAGHHAREWAQPDALLAFVSDLLDAYVKHGPLKIPSYTRKGAKNSFAAAVVPSDVVRRIVEELTLHVVPLANPDGRAFSQKMKTHRRARWRKNRAPGPAIPFSGVGVDIARNYNIAWDYEVYYSKIAVLAGRPHVSKNPRRDTFIGTAAASEPETQNIAAILAGNRIGWCIDLHAYGTQIVYPWAIEANGTVSGQTYRNTAFDRKSNGTGGRDGSRGGPYAEYFPKALLDRHKVVANAMAKAILDATGRTYKTGGCAAIVYPATGSLMDFAFSRQFEVVGSPEIHAFAVEFGSTADGFWPTNDAADKKGTAHGFDRIKTEVYAALVEFLKAALPKASTP